MYWTVQNIPKLFNSYQVADDGVTLVRNPYSWNKVQSLFAVACYAYAALVHFKTKGPAVCFGNIESIVCYRWPMCCIWSLQPVLGFPILMTNSMKLVTDGWLFATSFLLSETFSQTSKLSCVGAASAYSYRYYMLTCTYILCPPCQVPTTSQSCWSMLQFLLLFSLRLYLSCVLYSVLRIRYRRTITGH